MKEPKNKYKILVFDLDDTLIDNLENIKYAYHCMMEEMNIVSSNKEFNDWYVFDKKFWKDWDDNKIVVPDEYLEPTSKMVEWVQAQRPLLYLRQYYGSEISLEQAIKLNYLYMEKCKEVVIPIEGASETLKYLFSKGYTIVVATNGAKNAVETKLEKIGCLHYVNNILTATDIGYRKPNPNFFKGIIDLMKDDELSHYLMIGNSLREDVMAAQDYGIDACWYDRGEETLDDHIKPKMLIKELRSLKEKL